MNLAFGTKIAIIWPMAKFQMHTFKPMVMALKSGLIAFISTSSRFAPTLFALVIGLSATVNAQPKLGGAYTAEDSSVTFVRLDYASENDVPAHLQSALRIEFKNRSVPVSIYFALANDLNMLRIFGVQSNTDDFGYTHGSEFRIVGQLPNDYTLSLNYSTDLYTQPMAGELTKTDESPLKQFFTDENVLKLVLQHKPENQMFFWKAEAGWIELNQEYRSRFLNASSQQSGFHDLVNSISAQTTKDPEYINGPAGRRHGLLAGIYMGLAKTFSKDSDRCKKTIEAQTGLRGITLSDSTIKSIDSQIAFDCGFEFTRNRFRFESGYQVTQHDQGTQTQKYFDFSTKRTKWKFGFRIEENAGELINYVDYNQPNVHDATIDPIFRIYTQRDLK